MSLEAFIIKLLAGNKVHREAIEHPTRIHPRRIPITEEMMDEVDREIAIRLRYNCFIYDRLSWKRESQFLLFTHQFVMQVPRHRARSFKKYKDAFTGRTAKLMLDEIAGPKADYLAAFLFNHKAVISIGFRLRRVDSIIPDETLYRIDDVVMVQKQREIDDGKFPEETAYFEADTDES